MADYNTEFCFEINNLSIAELLWCRAVFKIDGNDDLDAEDKLKELGIEDLDDSEQWPAMDSGYRLRDSILVLSDRGGYVDIQHVDTFLQAFIRRFRPEAIFGYEYANTCSGHRTDGFGGGASLVSANETRYLSTNQWLYSEYDAMRSNP